MRARRPFLTVLAAFLLTLPLPLFAAEQVATLEPGDTAVSFHLEATGHDVEGKLYLRSGEIRLDPATGLAAGELVIDAARAESGNEKRDKTMHKKVLASGRHPWIVFRAQRFEGELAASGASTLTLAGTLSLLDVDHPFTLPLAVEVDGGRFTARTSFDVPYVEWGLENPSFAFLRVAKVVAVKVDARGSLKAADAVASAPGEQPAVTAVAAAAAGLDERLVAEGFRRLLPLAAGVEGHLRGVVSGALEHPGSLVRARLAFGALRRYGVGAGPALRAAVAIEYFHTASLIFDDMPAMDDARERRGRPCPHVTWGEAAATLGALALINQGYALLWEVLGALPPRRSRAAARLVAACLGVGGILNGQALDLHFCAGTDGEEVLRVAEGKTVSLIRLTLLLPAIVGGAGDDERERLDRLATAWGLAYQILDDFKDCLMSRDETGKSTRRDQLLGRPNLPRQAGFGPALAKLDELLAEGRGLVAAAGAAQLAELQGVLERERRKVVEKLPVEARPAVPQRPQTCDPLRFAARQLERWAGREKTVLVTVPAPRVAAEALLAVRPDDAGFLWDPGQGAAWAGAGAAHALAVDGPDGLDRLRQDAERVWPRLVAATYGSARVAPPRLYGGLAFDAGAAADELWQDFGDGAFRLPRWLYARHGRHAWLTLAVAGEDCGGAAQREACVSELADVLAALASYRAPSWAARVVSVSGPDPEEWCGEVEAIRRAIGEGSVVKVVAARRSRAVFDAPLDAAAALGRLAASPGSPTRFAFRAGRGTFLGVTPERLVARRGRHVAAEALAGSSASDAAEVARLLASAKELHEHRLVVDALARRLAPWCGELRLPDAPRVRELGRLSHLWTPMAGILAGDRHVLELVRRLHPTPAVAGTPGDAARRWIREHEREARGWYAAPVGWFDAAGDGEFAVALRCAVVRGAEAYLFAGAGILAESDPRREYAELELKRRALLDALGG